MPEKSEQDPSGHAGKFRKCSTRGPSKYPTFGAVLINLSGSTDLKTTFFIKIIAFWVKSSKTRDYEAKIATQKKKSWPKKKIRAKNQRYPLIGETYSTESSQLPRSSENEPNAPLFFWDQKRIVLLYSMSSPFKRRCT